MRQEGGAEVCTSSAIVSNNRKDYKVVFCNEALSYVKRNLWKVFYLKDNLTHIVNAIILFGFRNRTEHVLDFTLRQMEGRECQKKKPFES